MKLRQCAEFSQLRRYNLTSQMSVASDHICTAHSDQVTCQQVIKTAQLRPAPILKLQAWSIKLTAARRRLEEDKAALQQRADAVAAEESAIRAAKEEMEASAAALQLREAKAEVAHQPALCLRLVALQNLYALLLTFQ